MKSAGQVSASERPHGGNAARTELPIRLERTSKESFQSEPASRRAERQTRRKLRRSKWRQQAVSAGALVRSGPLSPALRPAVSCALRLARKVLLTFRCDLGCASASRTPLLAAGRARSEFPARQFAGRQCPGRVRGLVQTVRPIKSEINLGRRAKRFLKGSGAF